MRLIDADKLKMKLYGFERYTGIDEAPYEYAEAVLNKEPTVDAEPVKHGKWLFIRRDENGNGLYECSVCHKGETHDPQIKVNYCWNCGAKMESEEE